jgi:hypothetical protein
MDVACFLVHKDVGRRQKRKSTLVITASEWAVKTPVAKMENGKN